MTFNAKSFLSDFNIEWFPPGTKNVGSDFIGIRCPMCSDPSSHGGFNTEKSYYSCHRCGGHWMPKIVSILTRTNIDEAKKIIKKYSSGQFRDIAGPAIRTEHKFKSKVIYPPGTGQLTDKAKQYLISRNFDPQKLVAEWGLLSTGHLTSFKFRILAPIYLKGQLISYQCRDITGKHSLPYMGCPIEESVYFLKYTLYGFDKAVPKKRCVVVEGLTDNWRLGPGAVATFSMNFMPQQVLMLAKNFDEIFILYDAGDDAQEQADKLYHQLSGYNKQVEILTLSEGDPGDLSDKEAKCIMKEIGL